MAAHSSAVEAVNAARLCLNNFDFILNEVLVRGVSIDKRQEFRCPGGCIAGSILGGIKGRGANPVVMSDGPLMTSYAKPSGAREPGDRPEPRHHSHWKSFHAPGKGG